MASKQPIYILSDGTGETATSITKASLMQYKEEHFDIVIHANIRSEKQIQHILSLPTHNKDPRCIITYTFVLENLRKVIQAECKKKNIPCVDLLKPLIETFDKYLTPKEEIKAGILHKVNKEYFKRIDAIEFSLKYDDGSTTRNLHEADIVLIGVSRTSKTPLSIFLSYKGYKVANIPFVKDIKLPREIFDIDMKKVIALTIDAETLLKIRQNRLQKIGIRNRGEYADKLYIYEELEQARSCFEKYRWPVINVTDRALEETATDILRIIKLRQPSIPTN